MSRPTNQRGDRAASDRRRLAALEGLDSAGRGALGAEIDGVLAGRIRDIVLTPRLRAFYLTESWRTRSRAARAWLIWAMALNIVLCGIDYVISPPVIGVSLLIRLVLITPVFACLIGLWRRQHARWVEGLTLPIVTAAMMIGAGVLSVSGASEVHVRYLDSALCGVAAAIVIFPVELVWTVIATAIALGVYLGFSEINPLIQAKDTLAFGAFFSVVLGALVPARHSMNLLLQHGFLLALRSALQTKAIEDANARLSILASTDALTGLANRRAFEEEAARLWAASRDPARSVGIALLDIDHFKRLNDAAGHSAGDACLATVARAIQRAAPECRVVARYGGEEFVCLTSGATASALLQLGEAIRTAVESCGHPHPGLGEAQRVTVSVGVSLAVPDDRAESLSDLIRAADAALYRAKTSGRNRCVAAWAMAPVDAA